MFIFSLLLVSSCFGEAQLPSYKAILASLQATAQGPFRYCGRDEGASLSSPAGPHASVPPPPPPFVTPLSAPDFSLVSLSLVFRHGDRTSFGSYNVPGGVGDGEVGGRVACWPGDTEPWTCSLNMVETTEGGADTAFLTPSFTTRRTWDQGRNSFAGNCSVGQLTSRGFQQHLDNGADFVSTYATFLSNVTSTSQMYLRADDEDRCRQSLQAFLQGAINAAKQTPERVSLPWAVNDASCDVPVLELHTNDHAVDNMAPNALLCPELRDAAAAVLATDEYQAFNHSVLLPLLDEISTTLGMPMTPSLLREVMDCAWSSLCSGRKIPLSSDQMVRMEAARTYMSNLALAYPSTATAAKLNIGNFLGDIADALTNDKLLNLFGGHDTTLLPMMFALNQTATLWPMYASMMSLERYDSATHGMQMVRVVYNGEVVPNLCEAPVQGACPLEAFVAALRALVPTADDCTSSVAGNTRNWML